MSSSPKASQTFKLQPVDLLVTRILIGNAVESLQFLHYTLPRAPNSQSTGKELTDFVGEEIGRIIKEQRGLEDKHADLQMRKNRLVGAAHANERATVQVEIAGCSVKLKESYVALYRWLKESPDIEENQKKTRSERMKVLECFDDLKTELDYEMTFEKLNECVKRERGDIGRLAELKSQDKELTKQSADILSDLNWEKNQFSKETEQAEEVIRKLKDELSQIRSLSAMECEFEEQELRAQESIKFCEFAMNEREMNMKLKKVHDAIENEKQVSELMLGALNRKVAELTKERSDWTEKSERELTNLEKVAIPGLAEKQKILTAELEVLRLRKEKEVELIRQSEIREAQRKAEITWQKRFEAELPKAISLIQTVGRRMLEIKSTEGKPKKSKKSKK